MFLLVAMVSSVSAAQSRIPGSLPTAGTLRAPDEPLALSFVVIDMILSGPRL